MTAASALLVLALMGQVFLTVAVYLVMARRRFAAGRRGEIRLRDYVLVENEPPALARVTRNVANQFEAPVLFYALVLLILVLQAATLFDVVVAWLFVLGRIAHAVVHINTENVLLRSRIFRLGLLLVVVLALHPLALVAGSLT